MNLRQCVSSLISIAEELDNRSLLEESDTITKVAQTVMDYNDETMDDPGTEESPYGAAPEHHLGIYDALSNIVIYGDIHSAGDLDDALGYDSTDLIFGAFEYAAKQLGFPASVVPQDLSQTGNFRNMMIDLRIKSGDDPEEAKLIVQRVLQEAVDAMVQEAQQG